MFMFLVAALVTAAALATARTMLFGKKLKFQGKHCLITGGSAGIGFSIAEELVRRKANVTLLARTEGKLQEARDKLRRLAQQLGSSSKVEYKAADVTDYVQLKLAIEEADQGDLGPINVLIANAGTAMPGYFHEQDVKVFEQMFRLNYMGTLHAVHAIYPKMVSRRSGHLCLVSSALGTLGMVGYSAYAPSKYAVRGLADCLRNELQGSGVRISLAYPPDTDTPGFAQENTTKPAETKAISEAGATLYKPEEVARSILSGLERGHYILPCPDVGQNLHNTLTKGMVPRSFPGVLAEMFCGFIGPLAHWAYAGLIFDRLSRKAAPQRFGKLWGR